MATQIDSARRGVVTEEVKCVAEIEGQSPSSIVERVKRGAVIILKNVKDRPMQPLGIGEGLRVKVNTNIGTSADLCNPELELEKARVAVKFGSDTLMDLSTGGDLDAIRRRILEEVKVPLGTVPIYQAAIEAIEKKGGMVNMSEDDLFNVISKQARDGVDFITVHCGVTRRIVEYLRRKPRVTGIVSRGGSFLAAWMIHNERENPLYANFDYLLEVAREHDLCLSLGDGLRPGCLADASDHPQMEELLTVGRLAKQALERGVQCIIEGPGHMPVDQIAANVKLEKLVCNGAPYYVLGPLVTDVGAPYDHISAAIGSVLAVMAGADYLCVVTPSEHLGLPSVEEVKEGVVAARLAAHSCDSYRVGGRALEVDMKMAEARAKLDWESQLRLTLDPEKAREIHERVKPKTEGCSMCGPYCTYDLLAKYLGVKRSPAEVCR